MGQFADVFKVKKKCFTFDLFNNVVHIICTMVNHYQIQAHVIGFSQHLSHTIHVWYIYLHEWLSFMVNVEKVYISNSKVYIPNSRVSISKYKDSLCGTTIPHIETFDPAIYVVVSKISFDPDPWCHGPISLDEWFSNRLKPPTGHHVHPTTPM